jgi:hypothetical protein
MQTLLTLMVSPPKGGGKVLLGNTPGGPLPYGLEALLDQCFVTQLLLDGWKEEVVRKSQVQQIERVLYGPDAFCYYPLLHRSGGVDQSIVPMKASVSNSY